MASVKALPRNKFELTLDDGRVINGQYGTWAYKRFCDKRGIKFSEIKQAMDDLNVSLDLNVIADYVLSAVEQSHYEQTNAPFLYTDVHLYSWVDELGGIDSAGFSTLINPGGNTEEKKSNEPEALSSSTS